MFLQKASSEMFERVLHRSLGLKYWVYVIYQSFKMETVCELNFEGMMK